MLCITLTEFHGEEGRPDVEERVDSLVEWLELHSRELMYASIGLLVVAGGFWFYRQSNERQAQSASTALSEAESAVAAGNIPLAQSDLREAGAALREHALGDAGARAARAGALRQG